MMLDNIYFGIISYLPADVEKHKTRLESHLKQLKLLKDLYPNIPVRAVYQGYSTEDVPEGVTPILLSPVGVGVNKARNLLLEDFYKSDKDIMIMLDDDRCLYPHYNAKYFFEDLLNNFRANWDLIIPLNPRFSPFKKLNEERENVIKDYWILSQYRSLMCSGVYILRNIKKYKDKEIYFDEDMIPGKGQGYEDMEFLAHFNDEGLPFYMCQQLIIKTILDQDSVIFNDPEHRLELHKANIKAVADKYKNSGMSVTSKGGIDMKHVTMASLK